MRRAPRGSTGPRPTRLGGGGCAARAPERADVTVAQPWLALPLLPVRVALPAGVERAGPTPSMINSNPATPMKAASDIRFIARLTRHDQESGETRPLG